MSSTTDQVTVALTGELPLILLVSGCLGLLVSALLLAMYRRAVRRGMARSTWTSFDIPAAGASWATLSPPAPLRIIYTDTTPEELGPGGGALYLSARAAPRRAAFVYGSAGALFAAVLALGFLWSGGQELLPLRFLLLFWIHAWPLVPTLFLTAATSRRGKLLVAGGYFVVYGAIAAAAVTNSVGTSVVQVLAVWLYINLPPTVVFSAFLLRPVRAVGPLVVTFLVFVVGGASVLLDLLGLSPTVLGAVSDFLSSLGLGGYAIFVVLTVIGLVLFGAVGWPVLQWLRRAYEAKRMNDQSLILDALWLFFGISYATDLAFEGAIWVVAAPVAFAVYLTTVRLGLRLLVSGKARSGRSLLVLRVFALGKRSENLFRAVSQSWRHVGPVRLIAGPDLTSATVEPHEFLDFVSGRLERQFIDSPDALGRRVARIDTRPDFDGRFRVNDFFCHEDTWQLTLGALVQRSDAVLMDLRKFSAERQGCLYEIRQLFECMPLARIVMLVDDTTDVPFFEYALSAVWNEMPAHSPNQALTSPQLRVVRGGQSGGRDPEALLVAACRAATI